ncbi:iron complex transport system permease protein [Natranaerovirga hydrolytica]|uniref:Iron complex transport system permease protein n=1 Tax=Natranaerovirga hydrolytica TaxID=680378 RepID=A0A4R1MK63_9FIRM|nr:iron ABC transporter permease [Natranaerovirga hydrolytica]TCK92410.1 iron complex transport system permease protein [Natranaerovirga hydrolytica]
MVKHFYKGTGIIISFIILAILFLCSLAFGYTSTNFQTVFDTYRAFDGSAEQVVIQTMRMPRAIIATLVGACLAVSGAIMQALTRNPMASPGILGINAGASLSVVLGMTLFSVYSLEGFMWLSFLGAFVAAISVFVLGSMGREGLTKLKLTMAGVVLSSLFSSITTGLLILDDNRLESVMFWMSGSVEGRKLELVVPVLPFVVLGLFMAMAMSGKINALLVGEDVAKGLGQKTWLVKGMGLLVVVFLSGSAVAMAGPIGFVGLIIPHIVRGFVGIDYRWVMPYCAILGAGLMLAADIASRFILFPTEVPVGVATAVVGAPFFIYLARRGVMKG